MKDLTRNVLSLSGADVFGRLLSFLAVAYLARTLGAASMGIIAIGMAILTYASIFADAGLPILGTRTVAGDKKNVSYAVQRICSARFLLSAFTLVIGAGIISLLVKDPTTRHLSIIYLLFLFPSAFLLEWLFQGLSQMTTLAIGRIVGMIIYLLFIVIFVSGQSDLILVPVGWIAGGIGQAAFLWSTYIRLQSKEEKTGSRPKHILRLIRQGIPLGIATLISQVVIQFPFIYLGFFSSAENAGIYSVAFRVIVLMLVVDRVFYTIFFPAISRSFKETPEHLETKVDRTLKLVSAFGFYLSILAILAGESIFPIIFGAEFIDSSLIFQLLIVYFVLTLINSVFTFTLIGVERETAYTRSLVAGALIFFAVMLNPIPILPTVTAPVALALFQAVSMMVMVRNLQQKIHVNMLKRILIPLLFTILLIALFSNWQQSHPWSSFIVAMIVALPVIAIAAGINRDDLQYLKKIVV